MRSWLRNQARTLARSAIARTRLRVTRSNRMAGTGSAREGAVESDSRAVERRSGTRPGLTPIDVGPAREVSLDVGWDAAPAEAAEHDDPRRLLAVRVVVNKRGFARNEGSIIAQRRALRRGDGKEEGGRSSDLTPCSDTSV